MSATMAFLRHFSMDHSPSYSSQIPLSLCGVGMVASLTRRDQTSPLPKVASALPNHAPHTGPGMLLSRTVLTLPG
ncbi:hypothetical protein E2C01_101449 [Portunus trituberculatus]|uniref:Uncharacterized protein n=1 Tax=Portunus trituberculatus TaxID=210409 RepID=A0A5B7KES9_PORTR|nr:hypothetical protein [Portunus trituberculatus]